MTLWKTCEDLPSPGPMTSVWRRGSHMLQISFTGSPSESLQNTTQVRNTVCTLRRMTIGMLRTNPEAHRKHWFRISRRCPFLFLLHFAGYSFARTHHQRLFTICKLTREIAYFPEEGQVTCTAAACQKRNSVTTRPHECDFLQVHAHRECVQSQKTHRMGFTISSGL